MPEISASLQNNGDQGLQQKVTSSLDYNTQGDNRLLTVLYKEVEVLKNKVQDLETKKIIDETQLPLELLVQNGLFPPKPQKVKRGRGFRPLLQSEIEEVQKKTPFAAQQAKLLNVHFVTLKKYSKMYGIYNPHPCLKGRRNIYGPERGKYPLNKILNGDFRDNSMVTDWMVKDKLIRSGVVPPKCDICGYDKRRVTDNKMAILVNHRDGDERNFKLDNIQLLCYNCMFECGRGFLRRGKHMFDADWMQGARGDDIDPKARW